MEQQRGRQSENLVPFSLLSVDKDMGGFEEKVDVGSSIQSCFLGRKTKGIPFFRC